MKNKQSDVWLRAAIVVTAALAATFLARAQDAAPGFVVAGDAAAATLDSGAINLATAKAIAATCARLAEEEGVAVSVYVLDNAGNHVSGTDGHDEACAAAGLEAAFGDRATVPVY